MAVSRKKATADETEGIPAPEQGAAEEAAGSPEAAAAAPGVGGSETRERIASGIRRAGVQGAAAATSRIVQKAASILEEEIAAGIVAAKEFESRHVNLTELRQGPPEEVLHRFRNDAHEVVDLFMDLAALAARSVGSVAQRVVSVRPAAQPAGGSEPLGAGRTPTLTMPEPLSPGATASVPMMLENESDSATDEFTFHCSDLVSPAGERIPAGQVLFVPASVVLPPRNREQVMVTVVAPAGVGPGLYAGLLQASRLEQLRAVLVVNVK